MQVAHVADRVAERGVRLSLSDEARRLLGDMGYDPTYGARPLRRVIQKQLVDRLALALLEGEIKAGDEVQVDARGKKIWAHIGKSEVGPEGDGKIRDSRRWRQAYRRRGRRPMLHDRAKRLALRPGVQSLDG